MAYYALAMYSPPTIHSSKSSCARSRVGALYHHGKAEYYDCKAAECGLECSGQRDPHPQSSPQVLWGIMSKKLPELEGLTVSEFLTANGIEVTKSKISVSTIRKAWNAGMLVDSKLAVFKNVPALWTPQKGDDLWEENVRAFRVCSKEEAEKYVAKGECEFITVYKLVAVDDYRWDTAIIARAMKQGQKFDKNNDRSVESELAWNSMEEAYIVYDVVEKDKTTHKMRRISMDDVKF